MRLFVAVEVTDSVRAWATAVRRAVERVRPAAAAGLRWVAPEQVHLTMRFIGEVEPERAAVIQKACAAGMPEPAFEMEIGKVHWLPPSGRPRVLVSAIVRGADNLRALRGRVDSSLERVAGVGPEDRPFLAHLTLARVHERGAGAVAAARTDILKAVGDAPGILVPVDRLILFQSELSPRGPRYTALATIPLLPGTAT